MPNEQRKTEEIEVETKIKITEDTPLLAAKPSKGVCYCCCSSEDFEYIHSLFYRVLWHVFAFPANATTLATYFVSANWFLKHLAEAQDTPEMIREFLKNYDGNVTDLNKTWEIVAFVFFLLGSAFLCRSNQGSMAARLEESFGWRSKQVDIKTNTCLERYIIVEAIISGVWKTLVSSTSLLALGAPYIGFWPSLGITSSLVLGNFLAHASNFLEPFFQEKGVVTLRPGVKKFASVYSALSFAITNTALYFNTVDQFPERIGVLDKRLLQLPLPENVPINVGHGLFAINFAVATFRFYNRRLDKIFSNNNGLLDSPSHLSKGSMYKPTFWSQMTKSGAVAALYKTIAMFFATLVIISFAKALNKFDWPTLVIMFFTFAPQIPNYFTQANLFITPASSVQVDTKQSNAKLLTCFGLCKDKKNNSSNGKDEIAVDIQGPGNEKPSHYIYVPDPSMP